MPPSREAVSVSHVKQRTQQAGSLDNPKDQGSAFITRLVKTIEGEIIPRLLLSGQADSSPGAQIAFGWMFRHLMMFKNSAA